MDERPRKILKDLVKRYGRSLATDPLRTEGLLRDTCGTYHREIFVLVNAVRQKVPADLLAPRHSLSLVLLQELLAKRLSDELSLADDASRWAVESWANALDLIQEMPERDPAEETVRQDRVESSITMTDPDIIARRQQWADDLESVNLESRLQTVQDLLQIRDPENIRILIGALENGNWQVRERAFDALSGLGEAAIPVLCEALGDTDDQIIWRVSLILGCLKAREAIGPLILLLAREGIVCECAIWSLGEIGDNSSSTALLKFIRADDPVIQREAEIALGKIGNTRPGNHT
jgi:HEAT repeat protein